MAFLFVRMIVPLIAVLFFCPCKADDGYRQLFHSVRKKISVPDQKQLYSMLGFKKKSKNEFLVDDVCHVPTEYYKVELTDINDDGVPEVFVIGGNSCSGGLGASSIIIFGKKRENEPYQKFLGIASVVYKVLPEKSEGFHDIQFSNRGFCDGVLRWNGKSYERHRLVAVAPNGCADIR